MMSYLKILRAGMIKCFKIGRGKKKSSNGNVSNSPGNTNTVFNVESLLSAKKLKEALISFSFTQDL